MGLAPYGDPEAVPEKELSWLMPKFRDGKFVEPINFGKIHSLEYQETFHWHFEVADQLKRVVQKYGKEAVAGRLQQMFEKEFLGFISYWQRKI